jgi:F-type H+-transporting ATPase subunit gamma
VPSLKAIRKRISSVQSTQKITRAMKMVAGARLNRAQTRITELRPYAVKTQAVLASITPAPKPISDEESALAVIGDAATEVAESAGLAGWEDAPAHPLLVQRPEKRVLLLVLTSDRGLCGAFNTNINKRAEREWRTRTAAGQDVQMIVVGRKGRDYMARRGAPVVEYLPGVWDKLGFETAKLVGEKVLAPFLRSEVASPKQGEGEGESEAAKAAEAKKVDAIYIVYNEFKSAMTQMVTVERLLPVAAAAEKPVEQVDDGVWVGTEFIYEPTREALLTQLMPMYVDISILRALYESQASELGARMTAMDAATKNAKEMISSLTLQYNKARQAAITKELMEIIGGSEAIKE